MSAHFYSKQFRDPVDQPMTCRQSPSVTTLAFRSGEVRRLLLDMDFYGGSNPFGMFPLLLKRTADVLSPRPGVIFRG